MVLDTDSNTVDNAQKYASLAFETGKSCVARVKGFFLKMKQYNNRFFTKTIIYLE